jgi:magnesium chelatase family protein
MNPCPCGWLNDPQKVCGCAPAIVAKYRKRIFGPLLDRIDIRIEVPRVDYKKLSSDQMGETSEAFRTRVQAAIDIQRSRFTKYDSNHPILCNADIYGGRASSVLRTG